MLYVRRHVSLARITSVSRAIRFAACCEVYTKSRLSFCLFFLRLLFVCCLEFVRVRPFGSMDTMISYSTIIRLIRLHKKLGTRLGPTPLPSSLCMATFQRRCLFSFVLLADGDICRRRGEAHTPWPTAALHQTERQREESKAV